MSKNIPKIIDVVIPAHKKDLETLDLVILQARKNLKNIRRIIVVSKEKLSDKAEWFNEKNFPFSLKDIESLGGNSWYFQQFLKLYAPLIIPNISENVLIIDADTVFYRKVAFFKNNLPLYNLSKDKGLDQSDFHQKSLQHIKTILPEMAKKLPKALENKSGVCHHMLFQKHIIEDLITKVEENNGSGDKFYEIFVKKSTKEHHVSEYNLYFYFISCFYADKHQIRLLKYKNCAKIRPLLERIRKKYDYCSYHSYMRE